MKHHDNLHFLHLKATAINMRSYFGVLVVLLARDSLQ